MIINQIAWSTGSGSTTVLPLSINANGVYNAPSNTAYNPVTVNVEPLDLSTLENGVVFVDYNGSIIDYWAIEDVASKTALPANPSHDGLVAQGWNWTLSSIQSGISSYQDAPIFVSQMYNTSTGYTYIDIELLELRLTPYLRFSVNGSATIEWGDGSTTTVTGSSLTTAQNKSHTYSQPGSYTITIRPNNSTTTIATYSSSYYSLIHGNSSNVSVNAVYNNCVKAIRFGSSISSISTYTCNNFRNLKYVTIPSSITTIGTYCFYNCLNLKVLMLPIGSSVSSYLAYGCRKLEIVSLPHNVSGKIDTYAFQYCANLFSITIPNSITIIGTRAFSECRNLIRIHISSSLTSIGQYAFDACESLLTVNIPNGVENISGYAFRSCFSLTSISIPSGLTTVSTYGLNQCYNLIKLIFPSTLTTIGTYAFGSNSGMVEYHFLSTTPPSLGSNAFSSIQSSTKIYVPSGSVDTYKGTSGWSSYSSQIYGE